MKGENYQEEWGYYLRFGIGNPEGGVAPFKKSGEKGLAVNEVTNPGECKKKF